MDQVKVTKDKGQIAKLVQWYIILDSGQRFMITETKSWVKFHIIFVI